MRKSILFTFLLFLLVAILGYFIYTAKIQRSNLFATQQIFNNLIVLNKEFNLYLETTFQYDNFDNINRKIISFEDNLKAINKNQTINHNDFIVFSKGFNDLVETKIERIRKFKSYKAILNNSFRIIQKLKMDINSKEFERLYLIMMTLDKDFTISLEKSEELLNSIEYKNQSEDFFLQHSRTILNSFVNLNKIKKDIKSLELSNKLDIANNQYKSFVDKTFYHANISVAIAFVLLVFLICFYIFHEYKISLSNKQLRRFRKTVENSDNIVVITDKDQNIKYVNDSFSKTTGYSLEEVKGKKPKILQSGLQTKEFYDDLNKTIFSGNKWSGDFINIDRHGELSYEKASITPVLNDKGNIIEFIAIKLDITKETKVSQQLKEKERILAEKSKITAMLDMIENIAHQWRQPLSVITTGVTGMILQRQANLLSDEEFEKNCNLINENAQYLSKTIDDFNDFIKGDKNFVKFSLKDNISDFLNLVQPTLKNENIQGVLSINEIFLEGYPNQLIQCFMNFFNNSVEALKKVDKEDRIIFIDTYKDSDKVKIIFKDNAGGIDDEFLSKIFEPYFTSKHKYQGKGLGLHMNYSLITEGMNGHLYAKNCRFRYKEKNYKGAEFTVELPLDLENKI